MDNTWIKNELIQLKKNNLLRNLEKVKQISPPIIKIDGKELIDFSSNDYLGLSQNKLLIESGIEALKKWGCGSRASRLISGNHFLYDALEKELAHFKGTEAALVFGSGFLCNLTVISAYLRPKDALFLDRYCHASIVDGALLSKARIYRFNHNDLEHLETLLRKNREKHERCMIVAESVYSMDGDLSPVCEINELCKKYDSVFFLDEAHAIGVFGENGEGLIKRDYVEKPDILMGTFGKALGSYGAFCCTTKEIREFLINKSRGLIYSTALPPSVLNINLKAVTLVKKLNKERKRLLKIANDFREFISKEICQKTRGNSQIVPLILSSIKETIELETYLRNKGIFVKAIRPPTVPKDSPRIRISFASCHDNQTVGYLKKCLFNFFKNRPLSDV